MAATLSMLFSLLDKSPTKAIHVVMVSMTGNVNAPEKLNTPRASNTADATLKENKSATETA